MTCEEFRTMLTTRTPDTTTVSEQIAGFNHSQSCKDCDRWLNDTYQKARKHVPTGLRPVIEALVVRDAARLLKAKAIDPEL